MWIALHKFFASGLSQIMMNALIFQGPYFNEWDLAQIAQKMDEKERAIMAEAGIESEEYKKFLSVRISVRNTRSNLP